MRDLNKPVTIVMADDDEDDRFLANEALLESGIQAAFFSVEDGVELIDYLSERSRAKTEGLPNLILLDLNMPRKDGRQVLLEIKSQPALKHIPIVVLTTSREAKDISFSRNAGAHSFLTKPATFEEWVQIMRSAVKVCQTH